PARSGACGRLSASLRTASSFPGGFSERARSRSRRISTPPSPATYLRTSSASDMRHTMTMREGCVDSGGVRIHVVEDGPQDATPVLFVHGFPEFWWSWRHQITACAEAGFRSVAMDLRGFGDSDKPSDVADYAVAHTFNDINA